MLDVIKVGKGKYEITQICIDSSNLSLKWPILVSYVTSEGKCGDFLMLNQVEIVNIETDSVVFFNREAAGYYL